MQVRTPGFARAAVEDFPRADARPRAYFPHWPRRMPEGSQHRRGLPAILPLAERQRLEEHSCRQKPEPKLCGEGKREKPGSKRTRVVQACGAAGHKNDTFVPLSLLHKCCAKLTQGSSERVSPGRPLASFG